MDPPRRGLSDDQVAQLAAPLDRQHVRERRQGGSQVSYVEGWHVIAEANRIFGFDGWTRETLSLDLVAERERPIGNQQRPGWSVTYTARVRVTVTAGGLTPLVREGSGAGHGIDVDLGQAHESALKEAETDAMKRALMTFGNPFGLALYDKEQREVDPSTPSTPTAAPAAPPRPRPTSPSPAPARPTPTRPTKPTPPIRRTPAPTWISSQPATSSPPV